MNPLTILTGDCRDTLKTIPDGTVHCCVTSPPYWGLRDYGVAGQLGQEPTPDAYVETMVEVFREVRRCLHDSGTVWLNVGDSYARPAAKGGSGTPNGRNLDKMGYTGEKDIPDGLKEKDLCLIPWRLVMALQADGWWVRSVICWAKKSCMPESVTDRPTNSWEPIFLLAKSAKYFYDAEAVKEPCESGPSDMKKMAEQKQRIAAKHLTTDPGPLNAANPSTNIGNKRGVGDGNGRNMRNVWHLGPEPCRDAHFATFPTEIPRRAILAGTSARGCCPKCRAPWVRVIEKDNPPNDGTTASQYAVGMAANRLAMKRQAARERGEEFINKIRTVGWEPGCGCGIVETQPCTVLDCFGGSGTTGAVALELARHAVICELNPEYVKLIEHRTKDGIGLALA